MTTRDTLFSRFVIGLLVLIGVFLIAIIAVEFITGDDKVVSRMLTVFSGMFSGLLGIGTGYLLGRGTNGNGKPVAKATELNEQSRHQMSQED